MAKRITSPDEDVREEAQEEVSTSLASHEEWMPKGYVNPFDRVEDDEILKITRYPRSFSDIDFELKQSPRRFVSMPEIGKSLDLHTQSKSEIEQIWQYNRWKTWKYLEELPKATVIMNAYEGEKEGSYGTVQINGVTYYILKEIEVEVPTDVKEIILESQGQSMKAMRRSLVESLAKQLDPVTGLPKDPTRLDR